MSARRRGRGLRRAQSQLFFLAHALPSHFGKGSASRCLRKPCLTPAECAFISHCGADSGVVSEKIVPHLYSRKGPNGYFLHSSKSGGAESYKHIVQVALYFCRYAIVVASERSRNHPSVSAEVDWLVDHNRPIAIYRLDGTPISEISPFLRSRFGAKRFPQFSRQNVTGLLRWVDAVDEEGARQRFKEL
jgi:hypothetical protein